MHDHAEVPGEQNNVVDCQVRNVCMPEEEQVAFGQKWEHAGADAKGEGNSRAENFAAGKVNNFYTKIECQKYGRQPKNQEIPKHNFKDSLVNTLKKMTIDDTICEHARICTRINNSRTPVQKRTIIVIYIK